METKFNFNSKVCTDVNQSRRLLELGLKKETADMLIMSLSSKNDIIALSWIESGGWTKDNSIPAWSLHRLWELDNINYIQLDNKEEIEKLYDCIIDNIEAQIKEGNFNKEYLV